MFFFRLLKLLVSVAALSVHGAKSASVCNLTEAEVANGTLESCPEVLAVGAACSISCVDGFLADGNMSCEAPGKLVESSCVPIATASTTSTTSTSTVSLTTSTTTQTFSNLMNTSTSTTMTNTTTTMTTITNTTTTITNTTTTITNTTTTTNTTTSTTTSTATNTTTSTTASTTTNTTTTTSTATNTTTTTTVPANTTTITTTTPPYLSCNGRSHGLGESDCPTEMAHFERCRVLCDKARLEHQCQ
eukprot:TRINITY_DN10549_c2_g1_i1.p1 TRINITY_DN10549_c2_g1~~TRINITY_DN10549_c2_g1_i1.p1  ORF type:complete len:246 (-),score=31.91 TRINITY_DN10549_c2_g1_i1:278-1015(-)